MMLAAMKAMADADAVRRAGEGDAHCAAQAAAGKTRVAHYSLHEPVCPANRGAVLALRSAPQNQPPRVARNIIYQRAVPVLASD
jgi:hypothetical protein